MPLSATSATGDPGRFSSPSFTGSASGPNLTGGSNGEGSGAYTLTGITYAPDGDVLTASDSVNGQWQYEYGPLNRLTEACSPNCSSPATGLTYAYDRFSNRWEENVIAGSGPLRSRCRPAFLQFSLFPAREKWRTPRSSPRGSPT